MTKLLTRHPDPQRLWRKLEQLGWTPEDLAQRSGVSPTMVGRALAYWAIPTDDLEAITRAVAEAEPA